MYYEEAKGEKISSRTEATDAEKTEPAGNTQM